jgi:saccharopine dehydrogenase-like NADP-dependent oxidoreductase
MDINAKRILILGAFGQVGRATARTICGTPQAVDPASVQQEAACAASGQDVPSRH